MQPIQIVVISPVAANSPGRESSELLAVLLLFCLLCITTAFATFVLLGAISSLAANLAALVCVTLALGSVLGYVAQEVSEPWPRNTL